MKIAIVIILFIANISTVAILFSGASLKSSAIKITPVSSTNIKWGEGSEAGAPESTTRN